MPPLILNATRTVPKTLDQKKSGTLQAFWIRQTTRWGPSINIPENCTINAWCVHVLFQLRNNISAPMVAVLLVDPSLEWDRSDDSPSTHPFTHPQSPQVVKPFIIKQLSLCLQRWQLSEYKNCLNSCHFYWIAVTFDWLHRLGPHRMFVVHLEQSAHILTTYWLLLLFPVCYGWTMSFSCIEVEWCDASTYIRTRKHIDGRMDG